MFKRKNSSIDIQSKQKNIITRILERLRFKKTIEPPIQKEQGPQKQTKAILEKEQEVSQSKYYTGPIPTTHIERKKEMPTELPVGYGEDKIVLQTRDPWWLHAYWEVSWPKRAGLSQELGELYNSAKTVLRVYDVTNIIFNGTNANRQFDLEVNLDAHNWYIDVGLPGRSWCVDLGLKLIDNRFILITRSNVVTTPLDSPSWVTDEEWMIPEDMFARLYGMGFGLGPSSPVGKGWRERIKQQISSGILASPGLFSVTSPVKKVARSFWLVVNTELIVYGATEADAKVTVQGRPINLRSDGTFSLRFALPDGKQIIPVKAVSNDGIDEKTITPIVSKEAK